jgi:hypothetical protein
MFTGSTGTQFQFNELHSQSLITEATLSAAEVLMRRDENH